MEKNLSSPCLSDCCEAEIYSVLSESVSRHRCFTLPTCSHDELPSPEETKTEEVPKVTSTRVRKRKKKPPHSLLEIDTESVALSLRSGLCRPSKEESLAFSELQVRNEVFTAAAVHLLL